MSESPKVHPSPIGEREYVNAMTHFYRGELGRIMVWRQRLDMTTNWAVVTASAVVTFALSHRDVTHLIFLIANFMMLLLLWIEGRRYRYYDAFRARVRMLEAHFLVPVVMKRGEGIEGDWRHLLAEDLLLPSFKIGIRESLSRRLKRNYIWIFLILLVTWGLKICLHPPHDRTPSTIVEFLHAAQDGQPLPPQLFWGSVLAFYALVIALAIYAQKERYASGEMERRAPSRERWKI